MQAIVVGDSVGLIFTKVLDEVQLGLVVNLLRHAREADRVLRSDDGRGILGKKDGVRRDLRLGFLGVIAIVQAQADDLAWVQDGRPQPDCLEGVNHRLGEGAPGGLDAPGED